jgi:hypothetical protein
MAKSKTHHSSTANIPKQALDNILHYLLMQQIKTSKQFSFTKQPKHPHLIFQYYKNFQVRKRLRDTALSLLKTQYSKFPVDHGL